MSNQTDYYSIHTRARARCRHPYGEHTPFPREEIEQSVPDRFEKVVAKFPDRVAVEGEFNSLTYTELNHAANRVAHTLLDSYGPESEPVAMLFDHGPDMIVALLGIMKAGKFYLPLSAHDPLQRSEQILQDAEPKALLTDANNLDRARQIAAEIGAAIKLDVIALDDISQSTSTADPDVQISPQDYAYILYTSGSTGTPKGVIGTHRNTLRYAMAITNDCRICPEDRSALGQSISFSGSLAPLYPMILNGGTSLPYDVRKHGHLHMIDWLIEKEVTFFVGGGIFRAMCPFLDGSRSFPHLRVIFSGGGPTYRSHVEKFQQNVGDDCVMLVSLSSTEASGQSRFFIDKEAVVNDAVIPVGFNYDDVELLLWDEQDRPVPDGEIGEIVVRTEFLGPGYWHRPDITQAKYAPDPVLPGRTVYRTGDLGRRLPGGCLAHEGRTDFQVKVRGNRVEMNEVEARLSDVPGVHQAVVHAFPNQYGHELAAFIVTDDASLKSETVRAVLEQSVPSYAVPQSIVFLDALPRTSTGKVDRNKLPIPDHTRPELAQAYAAPTTTLEVKVAEIWQEILDLDRVGIDDKFVDLGGDSLGAARLLVTLNELTGRDLPFSLLAEASTVRELAYLLEDNDWAPKWRSLAPIQTGNDRAPLFLAPGSASTSIGFTKLARALGPEQPVYGFDALGLDGRYPPHESVDQMASDYIDEMKLVQPEGPYRIGGRCFGALTAIEMAHQLEERGDAVQFVAILDSGALRGQEYLRLADDHLTRWRRRRQDLTPIQIVQQSLTCRTRQIVRRLKRYQREPAVVRQRTNAVQRAHLQAWVEYKAKPLQSRMLVFLCQQYMREGYNEDWRALAMGDYVEYASDQWSHVGFMDNPENLQQMSEHLSKELQEVAHVSSDKVMV